MTEKKLTPEMLKDNVAWISCDDESISELEAYVSAWKADLSELARLRVALDNYAQHTNFCVVFVNPMAECDCGYATDVAALDQPEEQQDE